MEYASWPVEQPRTPNADRFVAMLGKELRKNLVLKNVERFRVTEETGDVNKHIGIKGVEFFAVTFQKISVVLRRILLVEHHTPRYASSDGCGFVEREIDPGMIVQQQKNLSKPTPDAAAVALMRRTYIFLQTQVVRPDVP